MCSGAITTREEGKRGEKRNTNIFSLYVLIWRGASSILSNYARKQFPISPTSCIGTALGHHASQSKNEL